MNRGARWLAGTFVVTAWIYACTFPDVQIVAVTSDGGDGRETIGDSGNVGETGLSQDAADDVIVYAPDATTDGPVDPCDLDIDGYKSKGGVCGGLDCDDHDGRRNPGVKTFLTFETTNGDWNCDNHVDLQFATGVNCGSILNATTCGQTAGFTGSPGCGSSGPFVQCIWDSTLLGSCKVQSTTTQIQGCM
jgi:hypothetical protein